MARIFTKYAWLAAVFAVSPLLCFSKEKPFVVPVLPVANWRLVDSQPLPLSAVSNYGGDPAVEQDYGVKELELRSYQLGKTRRQVVVETTPDATSAYGLLTFYQTPEMKPEKGMALTVSDTGVSLMARGNNFIRFLHGRDSALSKSDYEALLLYVGGSEPSANTLSRLPHPMPSKGLLPGSEKYLVGLEAAKRVLPSFRTDLIGFDQSAEVQLGQYQTGKVTSTLVSISYPTPQIARVRFGMMTNLLGLNRDQGENSVYGRREGSFVFLVLNARSSQTASALMDQFQVTENISWDQKYVSEKSFTLQLVQMILAIVVLTLMLIGACIVAGVLFFLSRRFAKRFFPDWQWGRTDEDQLIRLNLKT